MIKRNLNNIIVLIPLIVLLILSGCRIRPKTPPLDRVLTILNNVREGYNKEDMDQFCNDFSDIMYTRGFTKNVYLDITQDLKKKLGEWESEIYHGEENGVYTWQVKFQKGKTKLILVLDNNLQVTGLWFR